MPQPFGWTLVWISAGGCHATTAYESYEQTSGGDYVVEYTPDSGVACATGPEEQPLSVFVDFRDCFFCSTNLLSCEVAVDEDGTIGVHGEGSVLIEEDCSTGGTCEPTTAVCTGAAPVLAPGTYILSYGGADVPFTVPSGTWTCTGPSALAR